MPPSKRPLKTMIKPLLAVLAATATLAGVPLAAPSATASTLPTGPDVSSWQHPNGASINWTKVKGAGNSFAIIKATEGSGYTNPYFASDTSGARAAGLVVGAYHYARPALPISTAVTQAQYFASAIGNVATTKRFAPILDFEETGGLGTADLITWAQEFQETVRSLTGRTPILYSYPYFWSSDVGYTTAFGRYPLWLASYSSTTPSPFSGWSKWTLWQYTATASVPGVPGSGNVDMSKFNGTATALTSFADGTKATTWTVTAPAAPVSVSARAGSQQATVSWVPSDDGGQLPAHFTVTSSPGGVKATVSGTAHTATVPGLTAGTRYTFTVTATNSAGTSAASAASNAVTPGGIPSTPAGLTATAGSGNISLTWQASTGSPTAYKVYRCSPAPCTPSGSARATINAPTTGYTDTAVTAGTTYAYAVTASNSWGTSAPTGPVSATPLAPNTSGPPATPTGFGAKLGDGTVTLHWHAVTGASSYAVYECSPVPCTPAAPAAATVTTTNDQVTLTPGTTYSFAVAAVGSTAVSAMTTPITVTGATLPTEPTALAATAGADTVALTWAAPASDGWSAIKGYRVATDGGAPVAVAGTSWTATGLAPGTAHTFAVTAYNAVGSSPAASAQGTALAPTAVTVVASPSRATSGSTVTVTVTVTRSDTGTPLGGAAVMLRQHARLGASPASIALTTSSTGVATATITPRVTTDLRAAFGATDVQAAASGRRVVRVTPVLTARLSTTSVKSGGTVYLSGRTDPLFAGEVVYRQGYYSGSWHTWASGSVSSTGTYRFTIKPDVVCTDYYRVYLGGTWAHTSSASPTRALKVY